MFTVIRVKQMAGWQKSSRCEKPVTTEGVSTLHCPHPFGYYPHLILLPATQPYQGEKMTKTQS